MNESKNESTAKTNWLYLVFAFLLAVGIWAVADENHTALRDTTIKDIPVEYVDERFTSVLAHQAMLDGGLKKKARQDKALVDEISATIILQSYLESKKYKF